MYQFSQQSREYSQLARLPLAKFSQTSTSVNHSGPLNWNHIFGHGDIVGMFEKLQGPISSPPGVLLKVFRDQDILEEIDITHFVREAAMNKSQGEQIGYSKPIFAVIVKLPCLAIKYPSGKTSVRRFQIKFSSDRDYYTALAILSDIKCPFTESNIGSAQPIRKSTTSQWNPGPPRPVSGGNEPFTHRQSAFGPSSNSTIFPSHSSTANSSEITTALTGFSLPSSSSSASHTTGDFSAFNNVNSKTSRCPQHSEPGTSSRSNSYSASRPSTGADIVTFQDPTTLNQFLPPKRDLPFSKPAEKPAAKKPRTQTARTETTRAQTNKKPNARLKKVADKNKSSKTDTGQAVPSHPKPLPSSTQAPSEPRSTNITSQNNRTTALKRCFTSIQDPDTTPRLPPNLNTISLMQQQMLSSDPSLPIQKPAIIHTPGYPQTINHRTDQINSVSQEQHTDIITTADLSSYLSSTSTPERAATIENWICKHIEDDNFLQLCQDVEGVWKRIALGM